MGKYKLTHIYQNSLYKYSELDIDDYWSSVLSKQYDDLHIIDNKIYLYNKEFANFLVSQIAKDNNIVIHLHFLGDYHSVHITLKENQPIIKLFYTATKVSGNRELLLKELFNEEVKKEPSTVMEIDASKFKTFQSFCEYVFESYNKILRYALDLHENHKYLDNIMNEKIFDANILFDAMVRHHCVDFNAAA